MSIIGSISSSYRNKNGVKMLVYTIAASAKDLAAYENAQGTNFRKNEAGVPLYFTSAVNIDGTFKPLRAKINLIITPNGKVVQDDTQELIARSVRASAYKDELLARMELESEARSMGGNKTAAVAPKQAAIITTQGVLDETGENEKDLVPEGQGNGTLED